MKPSKTLLAALFVFSIAAFPAYGQDKSRKEFPGNHAPIEVVRPALDKVLSSQGRFVILPGSGNILVIDFPSNVAAAEKVLANLEAPAPSVAMNFAFRTNVAPPARGPQPVRSFGGFPFPTRYEPPRIIQNGNNFIVIPAHPTNFTKRNVGVTLDTQNSINPDGSINVDVNMENVEFEGFINYGSGIFTSGIPGAIPVINNVGNPGFFAPFANAGRVRVPIFKTTRISTQILVRPTAVGKNVRVDMIPQLKISNPDEPGAESQTVNLQQFRTGLDLLNNRSGKVAGFRNAPVEFNRNFLGAKDGEEGGTAIMIKAQIQPGKAPAGDGQAPVSGTPDAPATQGVTSANGTSR